MAGGRERQRPARCADALTRLQTSTSDLDLGTVEVAERSVGGLVEDAAGQPLGGVWLVLSQRRQDPSTMPGLRPSITHLCVHSDAQGNVVVRGLPSGEWQVIGNLVREGKLFGGSASVATEGAFTLRLGQMRE